MAETSSYSFATQLLALTKFGGMTPRLFARLFQYYGNLQGILDASAADHREIQGITASVAERLTKAVRRLPEAEQYIDKLAARDIRVSTRFDADYSELLSELNDPPTVLYVRGTTPSQTQKSVTLVGAHNATAQGITLTTRLAQQFARAGVQVISSLLGGNDAAAHLGAKSAGGVSFAVVDTGFDNLDQTEQVTLAIDVALTGGVLSEYAPEFKQSDSSLEQTDRLLVGLGQAVVVTEVYQDSRRTHDILDFCGQIGKLTFFVVDTAFGPLADKESLSHALKCGAIVLEGIQHTDDIIKSLV